MKCLNQTLFGGIIIKQTIILVTNSVAALSKTYKVNIRQLVPVCYKTIMIGPNYVHKISFVQKLTSDLHQDRRHPRSTLVGILHPLPRQTSCRSAAE